jgi:hypothetical protein
MPLDAFVAEAARELESYAEEITVGDAKRLVAAACTETVRIVFSAINPRASISDPACPP